MKAALFPAVMALAACLWLSGCSRLKPQTKTETVFVLAKQTYLRDRVAAVSNRVATVQNGQQLELLDRERRFLKVRTEKGEVGWIEEHQVVNPDVVSGFEQLRKTHGHDPAVGTAALHDDGYLHLKPGRDTDRYYLLPEGDKLQLLLRASVPKATGPQASGSSSFASKPSVLAEKKSSAKANSARAKADREKANEKPPPAVAFVPQPPPPPPDSLTNPESDSEGPPPPPPPPDLPVAMEDWWLVRDQNGRVGWLMARRVDVDVPDDIAGYAEGQRMVAAYLLRKVLDPGSSFPDGLAPEYVTVLNPYQDGLPYDFSQVRVFTWNVKKHRYETAFRQRNLRGYLPVVVTGAGGVDRATSSPTFRIAEGVGDSISVDPDTGASRPASTQFTTYVLEEDHVRKLEPGAAPKPAAPAATKSATHAEEKPGKRKSRVKHRHSR